MGGKYKHKIEQHRRLYAVWYGMNRRCYDPKHERYKDYGERGIAICDEWINDFDKFADWAISNGYDENAPYGECTLDRIDVNGNYEPSNCRFVTLKEQSRNRRNNLLISFNGEKCTLAEWSEKVNLPYHVILKRLSIGWSVEDALTKPVIKPQKKRKEKSVNMNTKSWFYSPSQVREILGVRQENVYELLESHQIPAFKIGTRWKIPKDLFHEWVRERALEHGEI